MKKMDYNTLPVGLGLAFATNRAAMDRFVDMTDDEKKEFVERSRGVMSRVLLRRTRSRISILKT